MKLTLIDLSKIFPMKPSEFVISFSVESCDIKLLKNSKNCYVLQKRVVSILSIKDIDHKFQ